jgi:hypothetical protein
MGKQARKVARRSGGGGDDTAAMAFVHCRSCTGEGLSPATIEVSVTPTGVRVDCTRHGLVVHWTPEQLAATIARPPACELCAGGVPHVH